MDNKACQSSADSTHTTTSSSCNTNTNTNTNANRDNYLRQLNKLSQKISKPIIKKPTFDSHPQNPPQQTHTFTNSNGNSNSNSNSNNNPQLPSHQQSLQHQPPVYNINKNDFRDVVQKLTGSPAHDRISTPPPIHQPKPPSSRLQRIRPPPLAQIGNRPPTMLASAAVPRPQPPQAAIHGNAVNVGGFSGFGRPVVPPLSPLPPLPAVHAAAESPVSAYLRYLHSSVDQSSKQFSGFSPLAPLVSPRWNSFNPQQPLPQPQPQVQVQPQAQQEQQSPPPQQQQQHQVPATQQAAVASQAPPPAVPSQAQFPMPSPPSPFGCLNSPLSSYPLLSPGLLFSPNSGQLGFPQLPLSPTVPVPSPRWRGL